MSRKILSLAYIYEMKGEYQKAMVCLEQASNTQDEMLQKEVKIGLDSNSIALNYGKNSFCNYLDMDKMREKIEDFKNDKKRSLRWFSKWN